MDSAKEIYNTQLSVAQKIYDQRQKNIDKTRKLIIKKLNSSLKYGNMSVQIKNRFKLNHADFSSLLSESASLWDVSNIYRNGSTITMIAIPDNANNLTTADIQTDIIKQLQEENEKLKEEKEKLKLHITITPGGKEYLKAQEHFYNKTTNDKTTDDKTTNNKTTDNK